MQAKPFALRCLFVLVLLSVFLPLAVRRVVAERQPARVTIDTSAFDKTRLGMTEAEVIAILGVPPGDYTTGRIVPFLTEGGPGHGTPKEWLFDSGAITVWLENGTVVGTEHCTGLRKRTCLDWIEEKFDGYLRPHLKSPD